MQRRSSGNQALATAILVGALASPLLAQAQDAQDTTACGTPCFDSVDDILGGQTHLLRADDLVLTRVVPNGANTSYHNTPLFTEDLKPELKPDIPPQQLDTTNCKVESDDGTLPAFMRLGRVYDLPHDVIVNSVWTRPAAGDDCSATIFITDPSDGKVLHQFAPFPASANRLAVLDADLDGYDDILVMGFSTEFKRNFMQFWSPSNVGEPTTEILFRSQLEFPSANDVDYTARSDLVSGDFNGDGAVDVAWLGAAFEGEIRAYFVSVCPAPRGGKPATVLGQQCKQPFEIVMWPTTLAIDTGEVWKEPNASNPWFPGLGLAAGDHDGNTAAGANVPDDEIVIVVRPTDDTSAITAYAYNLDVTDLARGDLTWNRTAEMKLPDSEYFFGSKLSVAGGPLRFAESKEQVVVGSSFQNSYGIWVLHFSDDLKMEVSYLFVPSNSNRSNADLIGIAIGRFDPLARGGEINFNQQFAAHFSEQSCVDFKPCSPIEVIDIFDFESDSSFTPVHINDLRTVLTFDPTGSFADLSAPLQAGDLQGRSLRLGPPEKVSVVHTQVDSVIAMPPMHLDFIQPPNAGDPTVLNISVFPNDYYTEYSTGAKQTVDAETKSTTSYTYAYKESAEEKVSYGIPDVASIHTEAKQAASQTHSRTTENINKEFASRQYSLQTKTVFDDLVAYTIARTNVYSYPVIGHTVCPEGSPKCPGQCGKGVLSCPKQPLHVQFSAPDSIKHFLPSAGATIEWYQPVQQPGNLFSYPGSLAQLISDQPQPDRLQQLAPSSGSPGSFTVSPNSGDEESIFWDSENKAEKSAGTEKQHTFDASVSVSGEGEIAGVGLEGSAEFDYNNSRSISTLNTSTTTLNMSEGVTVDTAGTDGNQPGTITDYAGEMLVFETKAPEGTIQTDLLPATTDVKANGPLSVGFIADLSKAGEWWVTAYGSPDVALNNPVRWSTVSGTPNTPGDQEVKFNCPIDYASMVVGPEVFGQRNLGCVPTPFVTLERPRVVAEASFYQMKGLFVRPGDEVLSGPPTNGTLKAGQTVTLQARVYNYSLAAMPADSKVHVDFYAQPWDNKFDIFQSAPDDLNGFAQAVHIGSAQPLSGIPAFCPGPAANCDGPGGSDTRNWAYAHTTWQTPVSDKETYWVFWVVTWIEDGSGLVDEIPLHGLKAIPNPNDINSLVDVPIETYSNNLGFYNQVFAVLPPDGGAVSGQALAAATPEASPEPELRIDLEVPRERRSRGWQRRRPQEQSRSAEATLTSNVPLRDVIVEFYEGDPTRGGTRLFDADPADFGAPFDVEVIPYIAADDPYVARVRYQPDGCGVRWLLVEATPMGNPHLAPASATTRTWIRGDRGCRQAAALAR